MTGPVDYEIHGAVALIALNNPPVNALGIAVRQGVAEAGLANIEGKAALDQFLPDPPGGRMLLMENDQDFRIGLRDSGLEKHGLNMRYPSTEIESSWQAAVHKCAASCRSHGHRPSL